MKRFQIAGQRASRGFSLPELMIVSAILAVAALVTLRFMSQQSEAWQLTVTQQGLVAELEQIASEVGRELRNGTRAEAGTPPNVTLPAATELRLFLPGDQDANGTILNATGGLEWDTANQIQYLFDAATGQLERRTLQGGNPVGATRIVGDSLTAVAFADQATDNTLLADEIRLTLTAARTTPQGRVVTMSSNSVIRLRN